MNLNPFSQLMSAFRLPGQLKRTAAAQEQERATANALAAKTSTVPRNPVATNPGPALAPTPSPAANPTFAAQLAAIGAGLKNLQGNLASLPQASPTGSMAISTDAGEQALQRAEEGVRAASAKSSEEIKAEKDLADLAASMAAGQQQAEERVIAMPLITGEQEAIERRAGIKALPLQAQLTALQGRRQAALDTAKTDLELTKLRQERLRPDEEKVDEFTDTDGKRTLVYRDKKTGKLRNEVVGTAAPKTSETEKTRALKTEAIKVARPALIAARDATGAVPSATYLKMRNDYAEAIGNPADFDAVFAPMLSPQQRETLGIGKFASQNQDIGAVLSAFLAGAGTTE